MLQGQISLNYIIVKPWLFSKYMINFIPPISQELNVFCERIEDLISLAKRTQEFNIKNLFRIHIIWYII